MPYHKKIQLMAGIIKTKVFLNYCKYDRVVRMQLWKCSEYCTTEYAKFLYMKTFHKVLNMIIYG